MDRSDELVGKAFEKGLSKSERHELREAYLWEQAEDQKSRDKLKESVEGFRDEHNVLDIPRHRMHGRCPSFMECPIDFKCRNYNEAIIACQNCELHETDEICMKPHLHNETNFNMILSRERIDLDGKHH